MPIDLHISCAIRGLRLWRWEDAEVKASPAVQSCLVNMDVSARQKDRSLGESSVLTNRLSEPGVTANERGRNGYSYMKPRNGDSLYR